MSTDTLLGLAGLSIYLLTALAVFGVVVVRRQDPSPHLVVLACHLVGQLTVAALGLSSGQWPAELSIHVGVSMIFTTGQLFFVLVGWSLAAMLRPGEPTATTHRVWLHAGIVAFGTLSAGLFGQREAFMTVWAPNLLHVALAFRDSPRLRRTWGAVASILFAVTFVWYLGAAVHRNLYDPARWSTLLLLAHHAVAMGQARFARPWVAVWPLAGLAAYEVALRIGPDLGY